MKHKKKSGFFTFIFSFLPGAAEMYTGFSKMGFSIMLIFFLSAIVSEIVPVLSYLTILIWFCGFFHARNIASMDQDSLEEMEDNFIWDDMERVSSIRPIKFAERSAKNITAAILIFFGIYILWDNFSDMIYMMIPDGLWNRLYPVISSIPEIVIAIVIIIIGVKLIRGKKEELFGTDFSEPSDSASEASKGATDRDPVIITSERTKTQSSDIDPNNIDLNNIDPGNINNTENTYIDKDEDTDEEK